MFTFDFGASSKSEREMNGNEEMREKINTRLECFCTHSTDKNCPTKGINRHACEFFYFIHHRLFFIFSLSMWRNVPSEDEFLVGKRTILLIKFYLPSVHSDIRDINLHTNALHNFMSSWVPGTIKPSKNDYCFSLVQAQLEIKMLLLNFDGES